MNWLLREWSSIRKVIRPDLVTPAGVDGLSALSLDTIAQAVGISADESELPAAFLLWEDEDSADKRRARAEPGFGQPPNSFTLAVPANRGMAYLPDERGRDDTLQLFTDYGGTFARVRATVLRAEGSSPYALTAIEAVNPVENGCPDGPCTWREACGPNCRCRMYTTQEAYGVRTPTAVGAYVLRCR